MTHGRAKTFTIGCICFLGVMMFPLAYGLAKPAGESTVTDASLVPKVRFSKEQFKNLVTEMTHLAGLMEKSDPQTAKVLIEAVNHAQRAWIDRDMDKVAEYLTKGLAGSAKKTGGVVGDKLREMLDIIRHGVMSAKDRKIDAELQKILNTQKTISAGTKKVDSGHESEKPFDRAEEIELTRLASAEGKLAKQIDIIRKKLLAEGTTVVFPAVLKEVGDDIRSVDENLSNKNPGKLTQQIQNDIETTLQEMIDAIRKEMSERRKKGDNKGTDPDGDDGDDGGDGKKPPLVSNLAELEMLYRLQEQIQRRTLILADSKPGKDGTKEQIGEMHKKLAGRQSKVKSMTEELKKKTQKGQ